MAFLETTIGGLDRLAQDCNYDLDPVQTPGTWREPQAHAWGRVGQPGLRIAGRGPAGQAWGKRGPTTEARWSESDWDETSFKTGNT